MNPLVIISCGAKKIDKPSPAMDLYIGSYFKMALRFAKAHTSIDNIRILSAKYGLIKATDVIAPYEMRITDMRAATVPLIISQAKSLGDYGRSDVLVVAGKDYNYVIKSVFPNSKNVVAGQKGMGLQMSLLKKLSEQAERKK
jgi:hypothetical protein